jgi:UDP-2,3-diacylglucosamine pyrophosphatase LpxH
LEHLREAVEALQAHGSYRKAAAALELKPSTFQNRINSAARHGLTAALPTGVPAPGFAVHRLSETFDAEGNLERRSVQTRLDAGPEYAVPAGHVVKGESTLLDPENRVLARWVKTREGSGTDLPAALRVAFAEYEGAAPAIPVPAAADDDLLTVYPLPDLHLGMFAWKDESGDNYDLRLATTMAVRETHALVQQSAPSKHAVLLGLGDYFHANDAKAVTPQSGHRLDVDGRWQKVFLAGAKLATALVDILARKHESVEVVFLPGNHDPDAATSLAVALSLFYSATDRINVRIDPGLHWHRLFGKVLLGATHGHTMKPDRMAMMLATDAAKEWGLAEHRHVFFGHIHHETVRAVGPVRCESFSTPAPKDAYAAGGGWRSGRALNAITFHREDGEIGRHRRNILRTAA